MSITERFGRYNSTPQEKSVDNHGIANNYHRGTGNVISIRAKSFHRANCENDLLGALPSHEYERIQPNLEMVYLQPGENLFNCGDPIRYVYFPMNAVIYLFTTLKNGAMIEGGVIGSEGALGISVLLGERSTPNQARVLSKTKVLRIPAEIIKNEFDTGGMLNKIMLRYIHALYVQSFQTAACNRHHSLKQKLCRWLLMIHDRIKSDTLDVTQEFISQMLGTRRPYITAALGLLQKEQIIVCRRGQIEILDRQALENRCCECYEVMQ